VRQQLLASIMQQVANPQMNPGAFLILAFVSVVFRPPFIQSSSRQLQRRGLELSVTLHEQLDNSRCPRNLSKLCRAG
jgi:hypothetical protein